MKYSKGDVLIQYKTCLGFFGPVKEIKIDSPIPDGYSVIILKGISSNKSYKEGSTCFIQTSLKCYKLKENKEEYQIF